MKNNRTKGFTLTELMVVILVIGILASVAIPEYMSAVDKSRWGALVTPTRSIKEAQEAKYMSTGRYASNMRALSVDIAGEKQENAIKVDKRTFTLDSSNEEGTSNFTVVAEDASLPNVRLVMYQTFSPNFADDLHCEALMDNTRANRLCQDVLDGTLIGKRAEYNSYLIEGNGAGKLMNWPQKMDNCSVSTNSTCYGVKNEDGSWEEHYRSSSGYDDVRFYDSDGHWYKLDRTYDDGSEKHWTFDSEGNMNGFEYTYPDGALRQKAEFYPGTGNTKNMELYYASGIKQEYVTYDENGNYKEVQYYWSDTGTLQWINNYDSTGFEAGQDRYWQDGTPRGISKYNDDGSYYEVNYRQDGTIDKSYDYAIDAASHNYADAIRYYTYNTDGTYKSSDGLTGTYTVASSGEILRSDGVVLQGSGSLPSLCEAHPNVSQCK